MLRSIGKALLLLALLTPGLLAAMPLQAAAGFWGRPYPFGYTWGPPYTFGYRVRHHCVYRVIRVDTPVGHRLRRVWICR